MTNKDKEYFLDQLQDLERVALAICNEMTAKIKGARVGIYQFDDDTFISPEDILREEKEKMELLRRQAEERDRLLCPYRPKYAQKVPPKPKEVQEPRGVASGEVTTVNHESAETTPLASRLATNNRQHGADPRCRSTNKSPAKVVSPADDVSGIVAKIQNREEKQIEQIYLDENYWYHKGVVLNQKQLKNDKGTVDFNRSALNCYQQALKLNPKHKASIFNLACAYEKLKDYRNAYDWFNRAIKVDDEWPDAHYGLVLCCL